MAAPHATSQGVDALIAKLRQEGVDAGRAEADAIKAEAQAEAARIVAAAKAEAKKHLKDAYAASDNYRAAGEQALNTAMRDAILTMKAGMLAQFASDVKRLVTKAAANEDLLRQMILELVGRSRAAASSGSETEVILPAEVIGPAAIAENPEEIQSGQLTQFVLGLTKEMLEDGVTLHAADDLQGGIRAHVTETDVVIDLSDDAVAALLMQHLQPRFRAVMEGVIR